MSAIAPPPPVVRPAVEEKAQPDPEIPRWVCHLFVAGETLCGDVASSGMEVELAKSPASPLCEVCSEPRCRRCADKLLELLLR